MRKSNKGMDTTMGGAGRSFPETTMGLVRSLSTPVQPRFQDAVHELCRRYWKPIYYYVRLSWAKSNEDAKDLTQAFFAWLLQGDALRKYRPERGGFRGYFKVLLRRFVGHQEAASVRLKRGGGASVVALDDGVPSLQEILPDPGTRDPEKVFDQAWWLTTIHYAVERVRARMLQEGREIPFRIFERHDVASRGDPPTYRDLALEFNLKETQVRDHLAAVRREVRAEIFSEIESTTSNPQELKEELDAFFRP